MRELSVAEQRYQAVLAVISDGETVTDVAARFGVTRKTVHAWLAKYEAGGLENLGDRSHRPRSCPHQIGPEVEAFEEEFARYLGVRHCIGVANGTDALTIVLSALGVGPGDEVVWPRYSEYLDFELELAMIVSRRGRDVPKEMGGRYIFGFTVFNDFSARDVQAKEISAWLGPAKGKDFANALGPCIVTADELGTEPDLAMVCRVNGEEWGRGRSSDARWTWSQMLAHVSEGEDVYPGDVYGSGTPGGCCGLDLGRDLSPGDVVELEIERIGILRNTIGPRPTQRSGA